MACDRLGSRCLSAGCASKARAGRARMASSLVAGAPTTAVQRAGKTRGWRFGDPHTNTEEVRDRVLAVGEPGLFFRNVSERGHGMHVRAMTLGGE